MVAIGRLGRLGRLIILVAIVGTSSRRYDDWKCTIKHRAVRLAKHGIVGVLKSGIQS